MSIKVSVCIPVYGVEKYIERCARSLFEQTMRDGIEFIFVNDCTPDKSIEILEQVLSEYPHRKEQTKIIHHEHNKGLVGARNTGLSHASGEYIIHCDSDDWVDKNYYGTMYETAVKHNADVAYSPFCVHTGDAIQKSILPETATADILLQAVLDNRFQWSLWNKMFRRKIAQDNSLDCPDHICHSEDLLRVCQMLPNCAGSVRVDGVYYHYFKGNSAAYTQNFTRKSLDNVTESVAILQKKLSPEYNTDTLRIFTLFMGIIYKLYSAKEFRQIFRNVRLRQIIRNKNSLPIKMVVFSAGISYFLMSNICNFLLKIRKKIRK